MRSDHIFTELLTVFLLCLELSIEVPSPHLATDGDLLLEPMVGGGRVTQSGNIVADGKGNLLFFHGGKVWSICDDRWDQKAADVACRQLGFLTSVGHTTQSYFGTTNHDIGLDEVQCAGNESRLLDCHHSTVGRHNCDRTEAAGVFCQGLPESPDSETGTRAGNEAQSTTTSINNGPVATVKTTNNSRDFLRSNDLYMEMLQMEKDQPVNHGRHKPNAYELRIVGGRHKMEGRVEIRMDGRWGVVCSDRWTMLEARVACKQANLGYARVTVKVNHYGGENVVKLASGVECDGDEGKLSECFHEQSGVGTVCPQARQVAGVVCSLELPDLVPNATLLEVSTYLQDQPMYYLQCAMEENCAAPSAFQLKATQRDWHVYRRRLLRFSSSTWNFGTAAFLPVSRKDQWEWHLCHMHYHSMQTFAEYDILDQQGNKVANGHKASFCLEDVRCMPGVKKKYACQGFGDQGISVGCADDYLHDIDCQWIDITDVKPGQYLFKVKVNPEYIVGELDFNNNAAICDLEYSGSRVNVTNCVLSRG